MTYSINAPMAYSGGNSLSPEPCVLSPRGSACFLTHQRGLWITRHPADRRPMQKAIFGGVR